MVDVHGFLPFCLVFGDLRLGPARGVGADDVLNAATLEDTRLLDPGLAVDAAMGRLENREDRPRQRVTARIVGIGRTDGGAIRIGSRQLLESEHQAGNPFEMTHLAEIPVAIIRDDGPLLRRRGGIPEETFGGTLLHEDAIAMQTAELLAEVGHAADHLFHIGSEADRRVLHEHLGDTHFDGIEFGLTLLPDQEAFGAVLVAREPAEHRERITGRDIGIRIKAAELRALQREPRAHDRGGVSALVLEPGRMRHAILGQQRRIVEGMGERDRPADLGEVRRPAPDGIGRHPLQHQRTGTGVAEVDDQVELRIDGMKLLPSDFLDNPHEVTELDTDLVMAVQVAYLFGIIRRIRGRVPLEEIPLLGRRDGRRLVTPASIGVAGVGLHRQPDPEHGEIAVDTATDLTPGIRLFARLPAVQLEVGDQALEFNVPRPVTLLVLLPVDDLTIMFDDGAEFLGYARKLRGFAGAQREEEHLETGIRRKEQFLMAGIRIAQVRGGELVHDD